MNDGNEIRRRAAFTEMQNAEGQPDNLHAARNFASCRGGREHNPSFTKRPRP